MKFRNLAIQETEGKIVFEIPEYKPEDALVGVVFDWDNIWIHLLTAMPMVCFAKLDYQKALKETLAWAGQKGVIFWQAIFCHTLEAAMNLEIFQDIGLEIHACPKRQYGQLLTGTNNLVDTVDESLIKAVVSRASHGRMEYFVLGSNDGGYQELILWLKNRGTKIMIASGSPDLISNLLRPLIDTDENGPMIFDLRKVNGNGINNGS